jgi:hypothetical protein
MDLVGLKITAVRPTNTAEEDMATTVRLFGARPPWRPLHDASVAMRRNGRRVGETKRASA